VTPLCMQDAYNKYTSAVDKYYDAIEMFHAIPGANEMICHPAVVGAGVCEGKLGLMDAAGPLFAEATRIENNYEACDALHLKQSLLLKEEE
jgi:hypothetical protein